MNDTRTWNTRGLKKGQRVNYMGGRVYGGAWLTSAADVEILNLENESHTGEYTVFIRHPREPYGIWVKGSDIVEIPKATSPVIEAIDAEITALQAKIDALRTARAALV